MLVVEDDPAIRQGVIDALMLHGHQAVGAGRADTGLQLALHEEIDLLLLDLVLPHGDGLDILKHVRATRSTLPIIILTARGAEHDRVRGLRLGADDYVVKPFSVEELLARVDAVLRRSSERPAAVERFEIPLGVVDLARSEVRFADGAREELSEHERELLRCLAGSAGRALTRDEILARVWRLDARGIETRTIDMHVARLRAKLRDDAARPAVIATVRGKGYKLGPGAALPLA